MSTDVTASGTSLSDQVAEEIRAWMGRRRMSQAQLARRLDVSPMWVSYRLNGVQEIGVNDMQRIADALGVPVLDLIPSATRRYPPGPVTQRPPTVAGTRRPSPARPRGRVGLRTRPMSTRGRPDMAGAAARFLTEIPHDAQSRD